MDLWMDLELFSSHNMKNLQVVSKMAKLKDTAASIGKMGNLSAVYGHRISLERFDWFL